jgi:anti-sigma factor RsiW
MEHAEIRRKLSAYLDDTVGVEEKGEIKKHLAGCGNCRRALADLEWTVGHLKRIPDIEPPPWLTAKIMVRALQEGAAPPRFWQRLFFPLRVKLPLGAVALVLLCATGYYLARMAGLQPPAGTVNPASEETRRLPAPPAPKQGTVLPGTSPAASSPVSPADSGTPVTVLQSRPEPLTPVSPPVPAAAPAPAPAPLPARPLKRMPEPELQPEAEGITPDSEAGHPFPREGKGGSRGGAKVPAEETLPAGEAEVTLLVDDPAAATGAIEQLVTRLDGRISGHTYSGENHLLFIVIEAQKIPVLLNRLGRIGTIRARPQVIEGGGVVDLAIRW